MKGLYLTLILTFISISLFAQANCERNLNDARSDYASGNLYAIPGKLTDCLDNGFTKAERIQAYQLLALTYININQQDKAKESLIKLLKIQTDYQVIKNVDPDELYSLYNKIETDPIYYIGAYIGTNYTFLILPNSDSRRTKNSERGDDIYEYNPEFSLRGGAQFIYPINRTLYAVGVLGYDAQRYSYAQQTGQTTLTENITLSDYTASTSGINIKVAARYMRDSYSFKPFIELGVINRLHMRTKLIDFREENLLRPQSFGPEEFNNENRRFYNLGFDLQLGSMVKFKENENFWEISLGLGYFLIPEVKYTDGLGPYINSYSTVVEDSYTKFVISLDFKFNVPFYNFK